MHNSTPRIVVIGSLNIDLTTVIDRLPEAGETIFGREFHLGFGGKGGNQAAAAQLCGAETAMVARVGDDLFGPAIIESLSTIGIDARHVKTTSASSTGVAPIFIDSAGQNRILVVKGANDRLNTQDVDAASEVVKVANAVILQLEVPIETVYHALRLAHGLGVRTILNPAPAQPLAISELKNVDYLIPNETEAEALTGVPIHNIADAHQCAERLLSLGPRHVVITLGEKGALYASGQHAMHIEGFRVNALDTSGAGDAFIGSFAYFLATGFRETEAISRANLYAALSTVKPGTRGAFPTHEQWAAEWSNRLQNFSR
ncbi:MAG TPA: ribokinase [Bryobacteraceae bacterium]|nr:ribokinase [Bryobacteraceae bacterium]